MATASISPNHLVPLCIVPWAKDAKELVGILVADPLMQVCLSFEGEAESSVPRSTQIAVNDQQQATIPGLAAQSPGRVKPRQRRGAIAVSKVPGWRRE